MYKSKRTIVSIAVAAALFIGYVIYAFGGSSPAGDDLKGWALLILKFIAVSVVAQIVTQVVIHVVFAVSVAAKEDRDDERTKRIITAETAEDEMDTRIMLRSSHIGYGIVGVGFVLTLIIIALFDVSAAFALNMLLGVFLFSSLADSSVSIYLYEKGENRWAPGRDCR
jgi:uncharacterized membrane protein